MTIKTYPMIAFGYYKTRTVSKFNYLTLRRTDHHHILVLCFLITIDKNI